MSESFWFLFICTIAGELSLISMKVLHQAILTSNVFDILRYLNTYFYETYTHYHIAQ